MPRNDVHHFPLSDDDLKEISKSLTSALPSRENFTPELLASLTVPEMKHFVKYINTYKVETTRALKTTGKKIELRQRLEKYLWPDYRQGVILPTREDRLLTLKTPTISNRVLTYTDSINRTKIEKDFTLNGKQDPYFIIDKLLDLAFITNQSGKIEINIVLNPGEVDKIFTPLYDIHLYWLNTNLFPQNWQDSTISWNDSKLTLPKANRKLRKPLKKKILITSAPLIIPKNLIRHQNILTIIHPNFMQVEGNLLVTLIRNLKTDDLIFKVKDRTLKWKEEQLNVSHPSTDNAMNDDNDLVMSEDEIITLNDPLFLTRIETPCRGKDCKHKTCFDLSNYLEYCHSSNAWNCPVCDKPLRYEDLICDDNIEKIINEVDPEIDKVMLHGDGTYTIQYPEGFTQIQNASEDDESGHVEPIDDAVSIDSEKTVQRSDSSQLIEITDLQNGTYESNNNQQIPSNSENIDSSSQSITTEVDKEAQLTKLLEAMDDLPEESTNTTNLNPTIEINEITINEEKDDTSKNSPPPNPILVGNQAFSRMISFRNNIYQQKLKPSIIPKSTKRFFGTQRKERDSNQLGNSEQNPIEID